MVGNGGSGYTGNCSTGSKSALHVSRFLARLEGMTAGMMLYEGGWKAFEVVIADSK
jgi:hypothetical protein